MPSRSIDSNSQHITSSASLSREMDALAAATLNSKAKPKTNATNPGDTEASPKISPSVSRKKSRRNKLVKDETSQKFSSDVLHVWCSTAFDDGTSWNANSRGIAELLLGWMHYWGHNFSPASEIVSIRLGGTILRQSTGPWGDHKAQPLSETTTAHQLPLSTVEWNGRVVVQDPFLPTHVTPSLLWKYCCLIQHFIMLSIESRQLHRPGTLGDSPHAFYRCV